MYKRMRSHTLMLTVASALAASSQLAEITIKVDRSERGLDFPALTKYPKTKDWEQRQKPKHRRKKIK